MTKQAVQIEDKQEMSEEPSLEHIRKALGPKCVCYVLITCEEPSDQGDMEVQLHFEGDESLAAFLIENASQVFEEQFAKNKID